ncbi:MAG: type VI secretion system baseplate subunit TssF [Pirellulaceae bacterium]
MSDALLRFYNSELQFIRRQGDEFSRAHPEVAAHLRFGSEGENDPYVGRLVEAFAYLNARTRLKLEDEFPEIAGSLIDIVLPHYQRPIPSMCIAQFGLDNSQAEQFKGYQVPSKSIVESEPIDGEPCMFRSCYPVTCWPFRVKTVSLRGVPFEAPSVALGSQPLGLLRMTLETFSAKAKFAAFSADTLRFYIRLAPPFSFQLYELLFNSVLGVALGTSAKDPEARLLSQDCIQPVGFGLDEGVVDYPPQSFVGYRLLSEYFAFPEKFLFFDVKLDSVLKSKDTSQIELFFYLNKRWQDLEPQVDASALQLGCTPLINLFPKRAEPIRLTHFDASYPIVPDARRPIAHEVYSVESVKGVSNSGKVLHLQPFYSFRHGARTGNRAFWHVSRREMLSDSELARGTELDIAFVDLDFDPLAPGSWTIDVDTICTNRNLPARMPFGAGQPRLQLEGGGAVEKVLCLTKPTAPLRVPVGQGLRWRIVSHLSLNHLSLVDDQQGATALRELLTLYDFRGDEITSNSIAGLRKVSSSPMMGRVPGDYSGAMCRGLRVNVEFDEDKYSAGNLFLFASVLERFFSLYCNINSFTQTIATSNRRQGTMHQWPARAGEQSVT